MKSKEWYKRLGFSETDIEVLELLKTNYREIKGIDCEVQFL